MEFQKVIGKVSPDLKAQAEECLSKVFMELALKYDNIHAGCGMGGDPLIFNLLYPVEHVCTMNMPTAATDGRRYYWNPKFVIDQVKKKNIIGLRIVCAHEAWHALYMHPQRRGSRIPHLWNIAVDYIVNFMVMDDLRKRKFDPADTFRKYLGDFWTLEQYADILRDPFKSKLIDTTKSPTKKVSLPDPSEDRELTPEEMEELEKQSERVMHFYADPDLTEEMQRPEAIYDYLYALLPKCPKCGSIGRYKKPQNQKNKKGKKSAAKNQSDQSNQDDPSNQEDPSKQDDPNKQNGKGQNPGQGSCCDGDSCGDCDQCGDSIDIFDFGDTLDHHMDSTESEEKMAKRLADAIETSKKMAGHVPGLLEDELGQLVAPKVVWKDFVKYRLRKSRDGNARNDWSRFKVRPLFAGLMNPKKNSYSCRFGCLLDTSGSMSNDDMAYGISQLASLDGQSTGVVVPADADIYWDKATEIKRTTAEEFKTIKIVGRGGTQFSNFFTDYEKKIGKCDLLIVITDGYLMDHDISEMQHPGVEVVWLITSDCQFKPPFGRVFPLRYM